MPPLARHVMEMRFSKNMKFAEIAKKLNISETAVYRHLRKALITIRKKLNQNG
ncbi:MAG: sigma-70 family RNA polymerase sigma factor [Muribaculaceae bacterium]|nr:sigma-70 family RNA polymerase sigma factor [Muribaculaceae bacterium]